jgi:hypothetical protein
MRYRDNMTPEELEQFKREIDELNEAYARNAQHDKLSSELPDEYEDPSDYAGMGWVGKDGRP